MSVSLLVLLALAQVKYPPKPAAGEFILDEAKLLKDEDASEIRKVCGEVLAARKAPIVVVTIRSMADYGAPGWPLQRYAMNLFAEWGVGWPEWNYGMLLLVSQGDRRARIELGASWGHQKDPDAQRVMNDQIVPRFKRGEMSAGILAGVRGLQKLSSEITGTPRLAPTPPPSRPAPSSSSPYTSAPVEPRSVPYQQVHRSTGIPGSSKGGCLMIGAVVAVVLVIGVGLFAMFKGGGVSSWSGSGGGGAFTPGCSAFAGGCLGSGLGNWFGGGGGGGYYGRRGYWDDPWDRPMGGGWFGGGGGGGGRVDHYHHSDSGSSSGGGGGSWSSSSSDSSSSSSGGGFSGGGGASGEW